MKKKNDKTVKPKIDKTKMYYYGYTRANELSGGGSREIYMIEGKAAARWSDTLTRWVSCRRTPAEVRRDLPARTRSFTEAMFWLSDAPRIGTPGTLAFESDPRYRIVLEYRDATGAPRVHLLVGTSNHMLLKRCQRSIRQAVQLG